jgi:hypothetical protein
MKFNVTRESAGRPEPLRNRNKNRELRAQRRSGVGVGEPSNRAAVSRRRRGWRAAAKQRRRRDGWVQRSGGRAGRQLDACAVRSAAPGFSSA